MLLLLQLHLLIVAHILQVKELPGIRVKILFSKQLLTKYSLLGHMLRQLPTHLIAVTLIGSPIIVVRMGGVTHRGGDGGNFGSVGVDRIGM